MNAVVLDYPNLNTRVLDEISLRLKRAETQRQQHEIACRAYQGNAPKRLQELYYAALFKTDYLKAQYQTALNRWRAENGLPQK